MSEDFWDWFSKAYGDVGDAPKFTKYNMEVAFAAGAENEAKRMWVGLTDDDYQELLEVREWGVYLIEAIEAKLKEKNT